jgi:ubiquinol-cytochrome c reductase cytochrome c1 subunit
MRYALYVVLFMLLHPVQIAQAESGGLLDHVKIDLRDKAALQRGAKYFVNYCLSCHEAKYVRYSQLAEPLGLTDNQVLYNLDFTGNKIGARMTVAMARKDAKKWFGVTPPDLSEIANVRGADWIYTYLRSFYLDKTRPNGVNNLVFNNVAMPDVVWQLQGMQVPVYKTVSGADGKSHKIISGLKLSTSGIMNPKQFDRAVRDLVTFLVFMGEPYRSQSEHIGLWVLGVLVLFTLLAYLLKREYWNDVGKRSE